jgi:hypothetical protein
MSGTSWRIPGTADPVEADCLFLFLFLFLSFSLPRPWLRRDYAWLIVIAVPTVLAPCIRVAYAVACTGEVRCPNARYEDACCGHVSGCDVDFVEDVVM